MSVMRTPNVRQTRLLSSPWAMQRHAAARRSGEEKQAEIDAMRAELARLHRPAGKKRVAGLSWVPTRQLSEELSPRGGTPGAYQSPLLLQYLTSAGLPRPWGDTRTAGVSHFQEKIIKCQIASR